VRHPRPNSTKTMAKPPEPSILDEVLHRIHNMARCGLYRDCAAVEQEMRNSPHYPRIKGWFNDPIFCEQINELCAQARRDLTVDRPDRGAQRAPK
jgi:hypothetical protein